MLGVSKEYYRKYESGATGLSAEKLLIMYKEYGVDSTYLITGDCMKDFDVDYYITNSNKKQKDAFLEDFSIYVKSGKEVKSSVCLLERM